MTVLIVRDYHNQVHHRGLKQTITCLRQDFWIVRIRNLFKKILFKCITCKRVHGRSYRYPPNSLLSPERLVGDYYRDLCGTLLSKQLYAVDDTEELVDKCYIVLYMRNFLWDYT